MLFGVVVGTDGFVSMADTVGAGKLGPGLSGGQKVTEETLVSGCSCTVTKCYMSGRTRLQVSAVTKYIQAYISHKESFIFT